jgi:hypothetical protein
MKLISFEKYLSILIYLYFFFLTYFHDILLKKRFLNNKKKKKYIYNKYIIFINVNKA